VSAPAPTTLVVDDEGIVRHLVRRMLEPGFCEVVEAEDGETALRPIDVVLTDLVAAAQELRRRRPEGFWRS
jgi:CheY-like chemotaxis protein